MASFTTDGLLKKEDYEFMKYVTEYGKSYGTWAEYQLRSQNFKKTLKVIDYLRNVKKVTIEIGLNEFADWSEDEIERRLINSKPKAK